MHPRCNCPLVGQLQCIVLQILLMSLNQADFDHFLCHDELLVKVRPLAGLLRERTPDVKTGTVGKEIRKMVRSTRNNEDTAQPKK